MADNEFKNLDLENNSFSRKFGQFIGNFLDMKRPLGSSFGDNPMITAPISGALLGAGIGGLSYGINNKLTPFLRGEREDPNKSLLKSMGVGAGVGSGVGAFSGALQKYSTEKRAYSDEERIVMAILNDPNLSEWEKQRMLKKISRASRREIQQILRSAGFGGITGALVASVLGNSSMAPAGALGGVAAGSILSGNYFS